MNRDNFHIFYAKYFNRKFIELILQILQLTFKVNNNCWDYYADPNSLKFEIGHQFQMDLNHSQYREEIIDITIKEANYWYSR